LKKKQKKKRMTADRRRGNQGTRPILVCRDTAMRRHAGAALAAADLDPIVPKPGTRGLGAAISNADRPLLVVVPSPSLVGERLDVAAREVLSRGGCILIWSDRARDGGVSDDLWIAERLLVQRGALADARLPVVAEAARVISAVAPLEAPIRVVGRAAALASRLSASLRREGAAIAATGRGAGWSAAVATDGSIEIRAARGARVRLGDVDTAAAAIALVTRPRETVDTDDDPSGFDEEVVDLIARPPRRLLSEATSKRLAAAFGLEPGRERLCKSPTEAARFAARLGGPAVLKLVRPALQRKAAAGAVAIGVEGAPSVRSAYHALRSLAPAGELPEPLGVIVAAQIDGGLRMWAVSRDHPRFGRLIEVGPGDEPGERPATVLGSPVSTSEAARALVSGGIAAQGDPRIPAAAVALARFCGMAHTLGDSIDRAEVHPLVVPDRGGPALALDVLIGVAGDEDAR